MAKIFISYRREDTNWAARWVVDQLRQKLGMPVFMDPDIQPGSNWRQTLITELETCDALVAVIGPKWLELLQQRNPADDYVRFEIAAALKRQIHVLPLMVEDAVMPAPNELGDIAPLSDIQGLRISRNNADGDLAQVLSHLCEKLDPPPPTGPHVCLDYLADPHNEGQFTNRAAELAALDKGWDDGQVNLMTFVAQGGVGKTALVKKWLGSNMAPDNFRGADLVLGFSFDAEDRSEDMFLGFALGECGDPHPNEGSSEERGRRLASLIREKRSLLILDGLEDIQIPRGAYKGNVTPGVAALLKNLANVNRGLCIVTTRQQIRQLGFARGGTAREIQLDRLSIEDAVTLLQTLEIEGPEEQMREVARRLEGNCLALQLMASCLAEFHDGQIEHWRDVEFLADEETATPAVMMLKRYERWLEQGPELEMLRIVGLFDRSVHEDEFEILRRAPAVKGLNEDLSRRTITKTKPVRRRLIDLKLLWWDEKTRMLDAHPLVREYFANRFQEQFPDSWKAANSRLYDHFTAKPDTDDLRYVLEAVRFGCRAERHPEAFREVFWPRIRRNRDGKIRHYSLRALGWFHSDLSALRQFFVDPWRDLKPGLEPAEEALILMEAGCDLRALARFDESKEALSQAFHLAQTHKDFLRAAESAGNLGDLCVRLGDLRSAIDWGNQAVASADRGQDLFMKIVMRGVLANALHATGDLQRAKDIFVESESLQKELDPEKPRLHGIQGFEYWDCLLSAGEYELALRLAEESLPWLTEGWHLQQGLADLIMGLAQLALVESGQLERLAAAEAFIERAEGRLNESARAPYIPRGALALGRLRRVQGRLDAARNCLQDALVQIESNRLALLEVDVHLELARVYARMGRDDEFRQHLGIAEQGIENSGYRVRESEMAGLCEKGVSPNESSETTNT